MPNRSYARLSLDDFTIRKSWANFHSTTADRTSRHGKIRMTRHCLTWSLLCASKEQWKARRRHNTYANAHWLHATTCYDVTYVAVSGRCRGSSKEAFCLTSAVLEWFPSRSTVSLQDVELVNGKRCYFWMAFRASFDAANPKGSKWMWCSLESSEEHCSRLEKKTCTKQQDQQNFLFWLTLIRIAQTGVAKKQMITNATLVGKFLPPPSSSITRLALTTWRVHVGEVTTWKFFLILELKHKI